MVRQHKDITEQQHIYEAFMRIKKSPKHIEVAVNVPKKEKVKKVGK